MKDESAASSESDLIKKAFLLHQENKFAEAEEQYIALLQLNPDHADALQLLGALKQANGELQRAVELMERSLALNSHQPHVYAHLGNVYHSLSDFEKALGCYENSIRLEPTSSFVWYNRGNTLLAKGVPDAAIQSYRRAVDLDSNNIDALCNEGLAYHALERYLKAVECYEQALFLQPALPYVLNNLGNTLQELGDLRSAIEKYDLALTFEPDYAEAYNNRGITLKKLRRYEAAVQSYQSALLIKPDFAEALNNLGSVRYQLNQFIQALECYNQALELRPSYAEAYCNRSETLHKLKRREEALVDCNQALFFKPHFPEAFYNRGIILADLKQFRAAIESFDKALSLRPGYAEAYVNRGLVFETLNRHEDALQSFNRALEIRPDYPDAFNNRGITHKNLKKFDDAFCDYDQAIKLDPECASAYWNKSQLLLLLGRYSEGWKLYEWRWKNERTRSLSRNFSAPLWLGGIYQKQILLHAEQGLGDTLQMLRYVKLVAAHNTVILEVPKPLTALASLIPQVHVICSGSSLPDFDFHCPLMSLPLAFNTSIETIPDTFPYLFASEKKKQKWRELMGPKTKMRVGLCWSGNPEHTNDYHRSIPLRTLLPILDVDVEFHSLQKEYRDCDLPVLTSEVRIKDWSTNLEDFSDTAGLIEHLDLVISVDTSVAHLAGALGENIWIMLLYSADFRWLTDRSDSPWYPSARLFRQDAATDWTRVVQKVTKELSELKPLHFV